MSYSINKISRNNQGQMSIFFAMTMLLLISCMAFIINVGMFVKAKINLQNAVDAAAFAGAAVQARQISNISYLNWEMRNIYKEWMFKYYVLGQAANPKTNPADSQNRYAASGTKMDFRISRFDPNDPVGDFYNAPSTCIHHAGSQVNICAIYSLPGLPRFSPLGLVGIDETHNEFMNAIVKEKAKDCSMRAEINFLATMQWIYGTNTITMQGTPEIASNRVGAWPLAFELAVRIRNLEKIVNEPPSPGPLCVYGTSCTTIQSLHQQPGELPLTERKVKAFWSAYRNLENNDSEENLKRTFKLTELAPTFKAKSPTNLDGVLIPEGSKKYYLDLRLILINYVNFYSLFSNSTKNAGGGTAVQAEAACDSIKMGLPVPGYPMGFDKNPEFLTYYAVKGEAEYTGLFNPFEAGAKMVAYAAAKPFGGRVGPMLFLLNKNTPREVRARTGSKRSYSYISGLVPPNAATFQPGFPMPISPTFWTSVASQGSGTLGGYPSQETRYGIPNLIYDVIGDLSDQGGGQKAIHEVTQTDDKMGSVIEDAGLYQKNQYAAFKSNLQINGGAITGVTIEDALLKVHSPTKYEALNYLIPTQDIQSPGGSVTSAASIIPYDNSGGTSVGSPFTLLAPLWGPGTFFEERANVINAFENFITLNKTSIETYLMALHDIARAMNGQASNASSNTSLGADPTNYLQAAKGVHDNADTSSWNSPPMTCASIAGKFAGFFLGSRNGYTECPDKAGRVTNLQKNILDYWDSEFTRNETFRTHYFGMYVNPMVRADQAGLVPQNLTPDPLRGKNMMTGYLPGVEYGASEDGIFPHPFGGVANITPSFKSDRNYYSAKFIALQTLSDKSTLILPYIEGGAGGFTTYSEGTNKAPVDILIESFENKLDTSLLSDDIKSIME